MVFSSLQASCFFLQIQQRSLRVKILILLSIKYNGHVSKSEDLYHLMHLQIEILLFILLLKKLFGEFSEGLRSHYEPSIRR